MNDLIIPKKGDIVECVRSGSLGNIGKSRRYNHIINKGEMGRVTFARHSSKGDAGLGYLTILWFNGVTSRYALDGMLARTPHDWKGWLRVVEGK